MHLNRLDPEQMTTVEDALANSPQLARQSRALREVLSLLDRWEVPEPPNDLAESVLARVENHQRIIPFEEAAGQSSPGLPARSGQEISVSPVLSLRELIAIAACITLFVGIFVPGYFKAQNIARRNLCRENVRQMFAGIGAYAETNRGFIQYAGYVPGGFYRQTTIPNVPRYSNSRPLYMLLRDGYVPSARVFVCPSVPHSRPMMAEDYRAFNDFAEPVNNTYSFQYANLPQGRRLADMDPQMIILADRNPFLDGRAVHQLSPFDDASGNSLSHEDGAGQNAIGADGVGGWFTQPNIGVDQDNIYRAGERVRYQGNEQPISSTDSFLVN
jgi:hypothetical protein